MPKGLTQNEVKEYLKTIGFKLIGEYEGFNKNMTIKCNHGHIFENSLKNIKKTPKCPICKKIERELEIKQNLEKNGFTLIKYYTEGKHTVVELMCEHGHINKMNYDNVLKGNKCKVCQHKVLPSIDFIKNFINSEGYELLSDKVIDTTSKISIKCSLGHIYETNWNKFYYGRRCPYCANNKYSKGENKISEILNILNIEFYQQYKFKECKNINMLPFDFYLPQYNICIEYDGIQHFEPIERFGGKEEFSRTKIRDNIKTQYCKDNNIKLIRIPYWDFDNIEMILKNNFNNSK